MAPDGSLLTSDTDTFGRPRQNIIYGTYSGTLNNWPSTYATNVIGSWNNYGKMEEKIKRERARFQRFIHQDSREKENLFETRETFRPVKASCLRPTSRMTRRAKKTLRYFTLKQLRRKGLI